MPHPTNRLSHAERLKAGFETPKGAAAPERVHRGDGPDYLDSEEQTRVLNPAVLGPFTLTYDPAGPLAASPSVEITVPTKITPEMQNRRRILDEMDSLTKLFGLAIRQRTPDLQAPSSAWIAANQQALGWASSTPDMLAAGRRVIALIAEIVPSGEDATSARPGAAPQRVSVTQLEEGLSQELTAQIVLALILVIINLRKNSAGATATAAAPPASESAQPPSMVA